MPHRFKYLLESFEAAVLLGVIGKGLYWIFVFLTPVHETIWVLCVVVLINLVMGLVAMIKNREKFSFSKFIWALSKLIIYPLVIAAGFLIETLIPGIPWGRVFGGFIGVWEGESIGRNFSRIYGFNIFKAAMLWISNQKRDWHEVVTEMRNSQKAKPRQPSEGQS